LLLAEFVDEFCLVVASEGIIGDGDYFFLWIPIGQAGQEGACSSMGEDDLVRIVDSLDVGR
jgi:hypothetical protein